MKTLDHKTSHVRVMLGFTLLCSVVLLFVPAIPQPAAYHQFADARTILGIPNFLDVISNLLLLPASAYGLKLLFDSRNGHQRTRFTYRSELIPYAVFFVAAGLTCFASMYYHLGPDNYSLAWDRLPMTIMFGSFLAIVISERVQHMAGMFLLPVLGVVGMFSVLLWYQTELLGSGDLRLYLMFQFLPGILIAYMLFFLPSRYSRSSRFGWILIIYALAKAAEWFDQEIFELQHLISGHTIKHVLSALAVFALAEMLRCRIGVNRDQRAGSDLDEY
ncbi:MAG: hypothetical protein R8L58_04950 [Mariprofundaceae bacterium]